MIVKLVKINKSKKLWIVMLTAVSIAFLLIAISFFCILGNKKCNNLYNKDIFCDLSNYYAEYELTIFSNKNQNNYSLKEWYLKNENGENFRFDLKNVNNDEISYVLTNKMLNISSNTQINKLNMQNYNIKKSNLISISTFFCIYNEMINQKENNIFKLEKNLIDDKTHYIINIDKSKEYNLDESIKEYEFLLKDSLKIQKLEVVIDNNKKVPEEYFVFNNDNTVIIGVKFDKFDILKKIDEKIFANFNK